MGIPIVTTDVPGCRVVVEHGINGYLVPPRDAGALARAIGQLVSDERLRRRFGEAGRRIAVANFDEDLVLGNTLRVYDQLTEPHPRMSYTMTRTRLSGAD